MSRSKIKFYFPKWIFPHNLGDSLVSTFIPKILKIAYPDSELEVITYGFLLDVFKFDPYIDILRSPRQDELYLNFVEYAFSKEQHENIKVVYPDWHPDIFSFWANHNEFFENHPSINIITVNYLLQLRLEHLLFDPSIDFLGSVNIKNQNVNNTDYINIGIVPSTKLSGKTTPHPDCDGLGFRFNGINGLDSWKELISTLKIRNPKIKIFEFSKENFGLGDHHFKDDGNIFTLINNVDFMDFGIMSDGGIHHAFNIRKKPVVLFQACLINKVEFFKLGNAFFPEYLHLQCRKNCPSYFLQCFGGENKSLTCRRECENLSPKLLGEYIINNVIK